MHLRRFVKDIMQGSRYSVVVEVKIQECDLGIQLAIPKGQKHRYLWVLRTSVGATLQTCLFSASKITWPPDSEDRYIKERSNYRIR